MAQWHSWCQVRQEFRSQLCRELRHPASSSLLIYDWGQPPLPAGGAPQLRGLKVTVRGHSPAVRPAAQSSVGQQACLRALSVSAGDTEGTKMGPLPGKPMVEHREGSGDWGKLAGCGPWRKSEWV